mmetsp:Transcript_85793/g.242506  ORF Transcript_85793/g.242506 Transcript_85793/m.242506 type:complete len:230 (-) Transcript_85793:117-806(-)
MVTLNTVISSNSGGPPAPPSPLLPSPPIGYARWHDCSNELKADSADARSVRSAATNDRRPGMWTAAAAEVWVEAAEGGVEATVWLAAEVVAEPSSASSFGAALGLAASGGADGSISAGLVSLAVALSISTGSMSTPKLHIAIGGADLDGSVQEVAEEAASAWSCTALASNLRCMSVVNSPSLHPTSQIMNRCPFFPAPLLVPSSLLFCAESSSCLTNSSERQSSLSVAL